MKSLWYFAINHNVKQSNTWAAFLEVSLSSWATMEARNRSEGVRNSAHVKRCGGEKSKPASNRHVLSSEELHKRDNDITAEKLHFANWARALSDPEPNIFIRATLFSCAPLSILRSSLRLTPRKRANETRTCAASHRGCQLKTRLLHTGLAFRLGIDPRALKGERGKSGRIYEISRQLKVEAKDRFLISRTAIDLLSGVAAFLSSTSQARAINTH